MLEQLDAWEHAFHGYAVRPPPIVLTAAEACRSTLFIFLSMHGPVADSTLLPKP